MSIIQTPTDGYGVEKTLYGQGVRLKAKNLTTARSTTLKITGMSSGAVWYVDVLVQSGEGANFSPPASSPYIDHTEEVASNGEEAPVEI
jgi:hypothetical protein